MCWKIIETLFFAFQLPSNPMRILLNRTVNCATIFAAESKQWLKKIGNRQLASGIHIKLKSLEIFLLRCSLHFKTSVITRYNDSKNRDVVMPFSSRNAVRDCISINVECSHSETNIKKFWLEERMVKPVLL